MKILVEEVNGNKLYRERETIVIQKDTISISYSETLEDSSGNILSISSGGYSLHGDYYTQWKNTKTATKTLEKVIDDGINSVLAIKNIKSYLYGDQ